MAPGNAEFADATRESVARAIHEGLQGRPGRSQAAGRPGTATWEALPEHLRESNRSQAAHIFAKLDAIGCSAHEADSDAQPIVLTPEEIERMAEMEHERWADERRAAGWTLGERDVEKKTSPYLGAWEEIPDEVREWDREAVRRIPALLASVGLEVRRGP
jgi:hypothetical protein